MDIFKKHFIYAELMEKINKYLHHNKQIIGIDTFNENFIIANSSLDSLVIREFNIFENNVYLELHFETKDTLKKELFHKQQVHNTKQNTKNEELIKPIEISLANEHITSEAIFSSIKEDMTKFITKNTLSYLDLLKNLEKAIYEQIIPKLGVSNSQIVIPAISKIKFNQHDDWKFSLYLNIENQEKTIQSNTISLDVPNNSKTLSDSQISKCISEFKKAVNNTSISNNVRESALERLVSDNSLTNYIGDDLNSSLSLMDMIENQLQVQNDYEEAFSFNFDEEGTDTSFDEEENSYIHLEEDLDLDYNYYFKDASENPSEDENPFSDVPLKEHFSEDKENTIKSLIYKLRK